jgi:hypothetical protein
MEISLSLNRRGFIAGAGGAALAALAAPAAPVGRPARGRRPAPPLVVGCGADRAGGYLAAGLDGGGARLFERPLPARGHGVAFHPARPHCAVFARRPGTFAWVLDTATGAVVRAVEPAAGRHFYGHGAFSRDGRLMFAAENDYPAGRGVLGVYDVEAGYRRIGEMPSHGVGPHDLALLPDGATLAVANGGIRTHPDQGRAKLNLATMAPNLAYLEAASGRLLELAELPAHLHKLSIRHLAVDRRGRVAIAMQYEGSRRDRVPLVGLHERGGGVRLFSAPGPIERRLRHYTGSIAFDATGRLLAVSGPRGHLITLWDAASGEFMTHVEALDASGLAPTGEPGQFLVSGGDGALRAIDARRGDSRVLAAPDGARRWDNHLGVRPQVTPSLG